MLCGCTKEEPVTNDRLIAHAGGAVYGLRYTNSKEALDLSYSNGHRYIELDFERTLDREIVLIHDWTGTAKRLFGSEGRMAKGTFLAKETLSDLTTLDLSGLESWLENHADVYIISDVKESNTKLITQIKNGYPEVFEKLIPQAYSFEEYDALIKIGCERVIFTTYAVFDKSEEEVDSFVLDRKPFALTLEQSTLSKERLEKLSQAGIKVFAHTVNDLYTFENWKDYGLYGIYTDYITPKGFPYN